MMIAGVLLLLPTCYTLSVRKKTGPFLLRVSILTRDIDIANLSVCLSVRNVPVSDENGLTYRHSFFTMRYPNHSSFTSIKHLHEIPTRSPSAGAIYRWGIKKFAIFYQVAITLKRYKISP